MLWLDITLLSLLAIFAIGTLVSLVRIIARRLLARGPKLWALSWEEQIQSDGHAGLKVKLYGHMLTLTWPTTGPETPRFHLDTRPNLDRPEKLDPFDTGVPTLDRYFAVRGATPAAAANLRANHHRLEGVAAFTKGWPSEFSSVRVSFNRAEFSFRGRTRGDSTERLPAKLLVKLLPQMTAFVKGLLSAAWWAPPVERSAGSDEGRGAYRGGGGLPAVQWEVEDPLAEPLSAKPLGPYETEQVVRWLQRGRLSWLARIRRSGSDEWQPMVGVDELQLFVPPPTTAAPTGGWQSAGIAARIRHQLLSLVHHRAALLVVMLLGVTIWTVLSLIIAEYALGEISPDWPRAPGKIVASRVKRTKSKSKVELKAVIRYSYEAGGQQHTSDRVQFGDDGRGKKRAKELVKRFPVGGAVQVYYAPENPSISTLETGTPSDHLLVMKVLGVPGGLIVLASAFLFYWSLQAWRARLRARRQYLLALNTIRGSAPRA